MDTPAADHAGPPPGRVHQAGQGAQAGLHGGLGAPEAERPGPAHGALQGPLQEPRRAGREADQLALSGPGPPVAQLHHVRRRRGAARATRLAAGAPGRRLAGHRAHAADRPGRRGRRGDRQHDGRRAGARHRRMARRALEPQPPGVVGRRGRSHHEAAVHQPPGRRRRGGGTRPGGGVAGPGGSARGGVQPAQPARDRRHHPQAPRAGAARGLRDDRRRRTAAGAVGPGRRSGPRRR